VDRLAVSENCGGAEEGEESAGGFV
jgi:hypothetical protein